MRYVAANVIVLLNETAASNEGRLPDAQNRQWALSTDLRSESKIAIEENAR